MSLFLPVRSTTILLPSGPPHDPDRKHLFVVCTKHDSHGAVLLVCACSCGNHHYDKTCLLGKGDHPFIKKPSYIDYSFAQILNYQKLVEGAKNGELIPQATLPEKIFALVVGGIERSPFTPQDIVAFYKRMAAR